MSAKGAVIQYGLSSKSMAYSLKSPMRLENGMKLSKLILLPLVILLMAFTNSKVSSRNGESLDASLQAMLKPLSQKERVELMEAFFMVAYGNHPDTKLENLERAVKAPAKVYITSRRMDTDYKLVRSGYLFGNGVHGKNASESFFSFIEDYGDYVDGKSGHIILREGRAMRTKAVGTAEKTQSDKYAKSIAEVEANLAKWRPLAQAHRRNLKRFLIEYGTIGNMGGKTGGTPMTKCDVAIAQGSIHLARLKKLAAKQTPGTKDKLNIYVSGDQNCAAPDPQLMKMGGMAMAFMSYYAPAGSPYPAAVASVGGADTVIDMGAVKKASSKRFAKALGYIRIAEITKFKVTVYTSALSPVVKLDARVKIHNTANKPIKRVLYKIIMTPKNKPDVAISINGRAPAWNERGPFEGALITSKGAAFNGTFPYRDNVSENESDYIFTPYVKSIKYVDGTSEVFVRNDAQIIASILASNANK